MNVRVSTFGLFVVLLRSVPATGSGAAFPLGEGEKSEPVRLSMKEVSSPWNNSVRIPVYLSVPPGVVLRSLSFAMACPKNMLSFSGAEKGVLLQSKDFVVETQKDVQPPAAGLQVVRLTVTLNESPGEKASIPNGLIVYVNFVVPDKVSGNVVLVENKILGAKTSDGRSLPRERLIAENGRVNILSPEMTPIVACFFYMH